MKNDAVCEWVVNEDELLLLARLISKSELEEIGEKNTSGTFKKLY